MQTFLIYSGVAFWMVVASCLGALFIGFVMRKKRFEDAVEEWRDGRDEDETETGVR